MMVVKRVQDKMEKEVSSLSYTCVSILVCTLTSLPSHKTKRCSAVVSHPLTSTSANANGAVRPAILAVNKNRVAG